MEREPTINSPESKESEYGKDVEIHAIFMRHGEKEESGELSERGVQQATEFGRSIENKDAIKTYSSPIQRVLETAERVIESAPHEKKLKPRIREELGIPNFSQVFINQLKEIEAQKPNTFTEFYLNFGEQRPDKETPSPHEVAEMFGYVLKRYIQMADRLKTGSKIDLINTTHQGIPEALLKEIIIRQEGDKKKVGFEKLEGIGGPLELAEAMEFQIKTDATGKKNHPAIFPR